MKIPEKSSIVEKGGKKKEGISTQPQHNQSFNKETTKKEGEQTKNKGKEKQRKRKRKKKKEEKETTKQRKRKRKKKIITAKKGE